MQTTPTEQDLVDYDLDLWEAERGWKSSQKARSEAEWLSIFPQAASKFKKLILSTLKLEIKYLNQKIQDVKRETTEQLLSNTPETNWRDGAIKEKHRRDTSNLEKKIRAAQERIKFIQSIGNKELQEKQSRQNITEGMIQKAKEYPLEKLVEINRQKFTKCFRHSDKTPSAYCKGNFIHCFVCNESWDTIAVLRERDGMTFKQAVLTLQ